MSPAASMPNAWVPWMAKGSFKVVKIWTGMAPPPGMVSGRRGEVVAPPPRVLRCRQQRLLRRVGAEGDSVQAVGCAAARAETRHRLHELARLTRAAHGCARGGRRIGGETADLPIQAHLSQAGGGGDLVVGDVVDLERAGLGVAHHQIALARHAAEIAGADDLPIESNGAHEGGAGDLIAVDVVDLQ